MNRVKFWVFTLLVVAAGYGVLHSAAASRRADAVVALDARLASAAAHVTGSASGLGREMAAAAAFVAADESVAAAVRSTEAPPAASPVPAAAKGKKAAPASPPPGPPAAREPDAARLRATARGALENAEKNFGFNLPPGTTAIAATRAGLGAKGEAGAPEGDATGLLRAAVDGVARRAAVRMNGGLWFGAGHPVGDGAGVVVLTPLDERWARNLASAAGVDVTLSVPDVKPVSTAKASDVPLLQGATKLAGAGDVGRPGEVDVSTWTFKGPRLPQPLAGGAPLRARAVPLEGLGGAFVVLSIPALAVVDPPAVFLWRAIAGLGVVLVLGLIIGWFVRSTEPTPQVPAALHAAAARIEKGDYSARAPQLAGKLGTIAAALNQAAEIAGPAVAARGAAPEPASPGATGGWYQGPARPASDAGVGPGDAPDPRGAGPERCSRRRRFARSERRAGPDGDRAPPRRGGAGRGPRGGGRRGDRLAEGVRRLRPDARLVRRDVGGAHLREVPPEARREQGAAHVEVRLPDRPLPGLREGREDRAQGDAREVGRAPLPGGSPASGSVRVNAAPWPARDSAVSAPPCSSAIRCAIASPRPVPPCFVVK